MPYEYVEDGITADVTFHAWGATLDELFTAAADATLNLMVGSLDTVRPLERRDATLEAGALDLLLLRFLDELIFHKDAAQLLLRAMRVHVEAVAAGHRVQATLVGEQIDPARHDLAADVKAVTLHDLRVEPSDGGWRASVTLDV